MSVRKRSRRIKANTAERIAARIVPQAQVARQDYAVVDVANHSDSDQRHMVRSGEKKTIRRLTRIEKLERRKVLSPREAQACEWYARAHAARYDMVGVTSRYGEGCGGGKTNFDHLPKSREQWDALDHYDNARAAIPAMLLPMFERIVIEGRPLGKLALSFRLAAQKLLAAIEGKVAFD